MKKNRLLFLLLSLFMVCIGARAVEVEIGDGGTTTNSQCYLPCTNYYNYTFSQQIYTADEIGVAGTINSIAFKLTNTEKTRNVDIFMSHIENSSFGSSYETITADDMVFSGEVTFTQGDWTTIALDSPFAYDGLSNLLLTVIDNTGSWNSPSMAFLVYSASGQAIRSVQDGSTPFSATNPPTTLSSGNIVSYKNQIILDITTGDAPTCAKPTNLAVTEVSSNSAVVSWTSEADACNLEYKLASDEEWIQLLNVESPYTLSGLLPGKTYNVRVQSDCGETKSIYTNISFNTNFGIPFSEEFGTSIPTGWSQYTGLLENVLAGTDLTASTYGWTFGTGNGVFDNHARANIYGNSSQRWLVTPQLYLEEGCQLSFDVAYTAYSGTAAAAAQTGTDDKFVVLCSTDGGTTWVILRQWDNAGSSYVLNDIATEGEPVAIDLSEYAGSNICFAFYCESTVSNADNNIHIDNVLVDLTPSCVRPTALKVEYTGGDTAEVTWTGEADSYDIEVNGEATEGVTSPYTLENLDLATPYTVKVRANCGGGDFSEWTNEVEFITDLCMPEDQCVITLALTDSYGDGWNGNAIQVVDNATGNVLGTFANTSEAGKNEPQYYSLNVCKDRQIDFVWVSGTYADETSWVISDVNEDVILTGAGTSNPTTGTVLGSYTPDCIETSCRKVTDLAVSEIASNSVKLSWTENGEAEAWTLAYKEDADEEFTEIDVLDNPYVLNNLSPETHYTVKVKSECDVDKWSDEIDFTTAEAGVIAGLTISDINPTTATASWTGDAENYELRYAPIEGSLLLQYDDDTYYTGIGNSSTMTWTWGVMYPADMVTGNVLTKVAVYETAANTGDITINIYQGGDDAPGTLIHTETVAPECGDAFHEITLSDLVQIDPEQNLWITLTETGTYVMAAFNNASDTNSQWVEDEGQWAPIGQLSSNLAGYGWMIRGSLVSMDMDNIAWTEDTSAESTYAMDGLEPNTQYIFQVRSVVDDSTYGNWATAFFDTPSQCDAPNSLAVADITATSANVSWVGYQEAYNLKYTNAPKISVNSFDQVGEDETATGVLTEYTFDLSGFEGTGTIAIRHYNVTDQFRLIIDDITLSDEKGETLLSEDFDDGAVPDDWINYDADGDGHVWMFWTAQDDNAGNPTANGSYALQSESYDNNTGALTPDNWLIIPNVELGGTLTLVARGLDPSYPAEVFGVFVSTEQVVRPSESVVVENVTSPYTIEGLEPGTTYMVEVQGVNDECGQTMWSSPIYFDTSNTITVTIKEGFDGTTVACPYALDFLAVPDLTVYKVTGTIGKKTVYIATDELTEGIVPAEEGILVKGPAGTYEIEIVDNAENTFFEDNLLVGAIEGYAPTSDDVAAKTVYRYGKAGGKCGFQLVTKTSQTVGAGKAYLRLTEALAQAAASLGITFGDDETTGIDTISGDMLDENAPMYNTAGQRVQKSYKGVVIQNGKKYIKK